jgi:hypothetical protein
MAESSETILSWNTANWITVVIMVLVLYGLMAIFMKMYSNYRGQ